MRRGWGLQERGKVRSRLWRQRRAGFTLIELIIVIAIIGVLAVIAIPKFMYFQLKSKSAEAKINLSAIRTAEDSYYSEFGNFQAATANPAAIPGSSKSPFDLNNPGFNSLGFAPEGEVFFSYGAAVSLDGAGLTIDAGADIDGDGVPQYWGYTAPDEAGMAVASVIGCDVGMLLPNQIAPCDPPFGQSVF